MNSHLYLILAKQMKDLNIEWHESDDIIWSSTDVLAFLLSDSLVFLQEKDQKYIFAAVVGFYDYYVFSSP